MASAHVHAACAAGHVIAAAMAHVAVAVVHDVGRALLNSWCCDEEGRRIEPSVRGVRF